MKEQITKYTNSFNKDDEKSIIMQGKNITKTLVEIALEFDPNNRNCPEEVVTLTKATLFFIGEIGYLEENDARRIFNRLIKNRTSQEAYQNNWLGVYRDAVDALNKLGYSLK